MKAKTRKLIAAITATAMLGSVLGVGAYAISKTDDGLGFKGTYDLTALAEGQAAASTVAVVGATVDVTTTLSLTSNDEEKPYTLFVTVIDTDDMSALTDIKVGYTIGGVQYNGIANGGLTNVVYSSLTVSDGTVTAEDLATNFTNITAPKLVIAEVETSTVGSNTAELAIVKSYSKSFASTSDSSSDHYSISGTLQACGTDESLTYNNVTYNIGLKTNASAKITFNLTKPGTLTLLIGQKESNTPGITVDGGVATLNGNLVTMDLAAGSHTIERGDCKESWLYYINVDTAGEVVARTYSEVAEVASTCTVAGTAAHYLGSDGKLYQLAEDGITYNEVDEAALALPLAEHTTGEWEFDDGSHWHICSVCLQKVDEDEHTDTDSDNVCNVCGATMATKTEVSILSSLDGTTVVGTISVYGDSDDIAYADLEKSVTTIPDNYKLTGFKIGETTYTEGTITVAKDANITAVFEEKTGTTYTYTYAVNGKTLNTPWSGSGLTSTSNSTATDDSPQVTGLKIPTSGYLQLAATGTEVTITMKCFTSATSRATEYIVIELLDADGYVVGKLTGKPGLSTNTKVNAVVFDGQLLEGTSKFVAIKISAQTNHYAITELTLVVS